MAETETKTRREGLMLNAINPLDGKPIPVQISYDRLQFMKRLGLRALKETAYLVPEVLLHPTAIFEGLRRDSDEDRQTPGWRCYCGKPSKAFNTDGSETNPRPAQVFIVFVNADRIAYNWRWENSVQADKGLPDDHEERFSRKLL